MLEKLLFNEFLFLVKISEIYFINPLKNHSDIIYLIILVLVIHILFYYLWKYLRLIFKIKLSKNNIIKNIYFLQFFPILWFFLFIYLWIRNELSFKELLKYVFFTKIVYYLYFILSFILINIFIILKYDTLLQIIKHGNNLVLFFHTIFPFFIFLIFLGIKLFYNFRKTN